ncbi:hypothetical protein CTAYLR_008712 [Chrysophaeum taylorii]|uniref:ABC1 atypical kinase-like domain-containing protein n=1 Tax=Chrysophaeum taylorii TaxID=2483200 RepID=A0AAD7ULR8_9STRA|nr:hypothetical protein CTAYLR_008712 [Chrysophaeum taylorii]
MARGVTIDDDDDDDDEASSSMVEAVVVIVRKKDRGGGLLVRHLAEDERQRARIEAAGRAVRLVTTAARVALDYQLAPAAADPTASAWRRELDEATGEQEAAGLAVSRARTPEERSAGAARAADARARIVRATAELSAAEPGGENPLHERNARRLLRMVRQNGGVYLKIAQHAAQLDYLIPKEYIAHFEKCLDDSPTSSYANVERVLREEGVSLEALEPEPIASGSLAQVHRANFGGRQVAVKVQHLGLRETSRGDVEAVAAVVRLASRLFPDFKLGWLVDEIAPHLAVELDFRQEARNCRRAAAHFASWRRVVVPEVLHATERVLVMSFESGVNATDVAAKQPNRPRSSLRRVARTVAAAFAAQTFRHGFVHCDPHGANVLVRDDDAIVLLDHGLYRHLDDDFRLTYARLWRALVLADVKAIELHARRLGVGDAYPLFAAMLTRKTWDQVANPDAALDMTPTNDALLQVYAQRYVKQITHVLDAAPRQLLLLLKMSDCLRRLDSAMLGNHHSDGHDPSLFTLHACLDALHAHDRDHLTYARVKLSVWLFQLKKRMFKLAWWVLPSALLN